MSHVYHGCDFKHNIGFAYSNWTPRSWCQAESFSTCFPAFFGDLNKALSEQFPGWRVRPPVPQAFCRVCTERAGTGQKPFKLSPRANSSPCSCSPSQRQCGAEQCGLCVLFTAPLLPRICFRAFASARLFAHLWLHCCIANASECIPHRCTNAVRLLLGLRFFLASLA